MATYETLKQIISPNIGIWESHIVTIIFTAILATITAFIALRKYQNLYKLLSGILPICCICKKIRDKDEKWKQIDEYIHVHSEASFSHGYCPECFQKRKNELLDNAADLRGGDIGGGNLNN